jgi:hypothetical protein
VTPVPVGRNPFENGREVTLAEAKASQPLPVLLPSTESANRDNLTTVWLSDSETQLAFDFVSIDARIWVERPPAFFGSDPEPALAKEAAALGLRQSALVTVDGHPALVKPGTTDGHGFLDMMYASDVRVVITAPLSANDLKQMGATLHEAS